MPDVATRPISSLPAGTALSRYLHAITATRGDLLAARAVAAEWRNTPQVYTALDLQVSGKSATAAGSTSDATWAKPLVTSGIAAEAITLLRGISIVSQLEGRLRRTPFNTKVPKDDTIALLGGWVAENSPIPVASLAFSAVGPLDATKVAVIVPMTRELVVTGIPATEAVVRRAVLGGLAARIDQLFLLPTAAAAPGMPASITNGATEVVSTGSSAAQIIADLNAMRAAITTGGGNLVWVMRPTTMSAIAAALGKESGLPQTLFALSVVASKNSPAQVTLLDGDAILLADDGEFDVTLSRSASVQMNDAPDNPVVAATIATSFFQNNLIGIRALRVINWLRVATGGVVFMTVSY